MAFLLAGALLLAHGAVGNPGVLLAAEETHEGKIVSAGEGKVVIVGDNGENQEFEVGEKAKITRNEKSVDLDDLQEGDVAKVTVTRKGKKLVATKIEATAPE